MLPHPYMLERSFVLVTLAEIAPELVLANGMTAVQCRDRLDDRFSIVKAGKAKQNMNSRVKRGVFSWKKNEKMAR